MNDGVVANLDKSVSTGIGVGTGNKVSPVSDRIGTGSPKATFNTCTGRVDVVTRNVSSCRVPIRASNLLGSGRAPIRGVGNSESSSILDQGRDEHGFITRENSLAERQRLAGLVDSIHGASSVDAVRLVGEGL